MISPMPVQDVHAGREALRRDLGRYLSGTSLTEKGWSQPDDLTLLIPIFASVGPGQSDLYLLKLVFDHYPKGPPSAQFVNPLTLEYKYPQDVMWVPKSESMPLIQFHPNYNNNQQLICSSSTLEFYKVNHDVADAHVWSEERMNFMTTVAAIRAGLAPAYYKGRATQ